MHLILPPVIVQSVGALAAAGFFSWAVLVGADTLVGIVRRTGNDGVFSWAYLSHFLVANFATTEAKVMLGLIATGGLNAFLAASVHASSLDQAFAAGATASLAAFAAGAVTQDAALVKDILAKVTGPSAAERRKQVGR